MSFNQLIPGNYLKLGAFILFLLAIPPELVAAVTKVSGVTVTATAPSFNAATQTYESYITLTNTSKKKSVKGPLVLQISQISKKGTVVAEPTGFIKKNAYVALPLPNGELAPLQALAGFVVRFNNPSNKKFTYSKTLNTGVDQYQPVLPNHMPVANAGYDLPVTINNNVILNGTASIDPDGQLLSYRWTLLEKPANSTVVLSNAQTPRPSLVPDLAGQYKVQLIVNDGKIDSFPDVVLLNTGNVAPVALIEPDKTALLRSVISLDGSASFDSNSNDLLNYVWTLPVKPSGSKAKITPITVAAPSLKIDKPGAYWAWLQVKDGQSVSTPATIRITTSGSAPHANAGPDQMGHTINQPVILSGALSADSDKQALSYQWSLLYKPTDSQSQLSQTDQVSSQFTPDKIGDYIAQLIVSDGKNPSSPDTVLINVLDVENQPINHIPQITSTAINSATVNQLYQYQVIANDQDLSDLLAFSLLTAPTGMGINPQTGLITWTPQANQTGSQDVSIKVQDTQSGTDTQSFQINVAESPKTFATVPNASGLTKEAATSALSLAQLNLGTISNEYSDTVSVGKVISQSLAADSKVVLGSSVNLVISLGPNTGGPTDPGTAAPKLAAAVASNTFETSQFLYSGSQPVQTGVAQDAIKAERAAVISGKVLNKAGEPLSGVTISLLDHPELGQTQSRADGLYDLAVNGGGLLTLTYIKPGYLPAQRSLDVAWQVGVTVDNMTLVAQDSQVSTVNLSDSSEAIHVAQSSVIKDGDGTRQATLLIPQGTQAHIFNPDGTTKPVNTLNLRLTEYTTGANGEASMPGPLPASSAYTYAFEMKADEADVKINGRDVMFDSPVPFYIDNFLNFPVGSTVPVGYYDKDKGVWVPSQNGKVIKILTISNGLANLDTDGDQVADDAAKLAVLSITDAERQKLASLYPQGNRSLWRVQVTHLSTWDCNWPYRMPDDAEQPQNPPPDNQDDNKPDDPCKSGGSIIECENQTLGENIPLTGTSMSLEYASDRVPGRKQANTLNIPLSGASVPASLKRIDLEIYLAGRKFEYSAPAQPNQKYTFTWDGLDSYGRKLSGSQTAKIRIGFAYAPVYSTPAELQASFARFTGVPLEGSRARNEVRIWQELETKIGAWDYQSQGLGGWSLSGVHVYDPNGKVLYMGDGSRKGSKQTFQSLVSTLAGNGTAGLTGDGGQAKQARVSRPSGLAVHPDGSVYVADTENGRVRRIATDGVISTFAGTTPGFAGDGGPATSAQLNRPESVAFAPDGSLYVADSGNSRIRRIDSNGVITTVVGTGQPGFSGDNGPATSAKISYPKSLVVAQDGNLYFSDVANHRIRQVGTDGNISTIVGNGQAGLSGDGGPALQAKVAYPEGMAVTASGVLYVADSGNNRIRRISPDGMITTFAGSTAGFSGDGGQAKLARLYYPSNIALGRDGSLFISDSGNDRIRRISPDGLISTIVGNGERSFAGDNGPAAQAKVNYPSGMAVGADGRLYFSDNGNNRVRRVSQSLDGFTNSDIFIASTDGSVIYHFNAFGRHLSTLHGLTGATLLTMTYDSAGRLTAVTDANGNATSIERNSTGYATAIVGPFGQKTTLAYDSNGYLSKVINPAAESYQMAYGNAGLLTEFTKPRGFKSTMTYDDMGRLIKDQDAAGGSQTLARSIFANGFEVTRTTALNRAYKYRLENLPTGDQKRSNTHADGTVTETVKGADGSINTTQSDGTITQMLQGPDPRFAMQVLVMKTATMTTGGIIATMGDERTVSLSDPNNPLSLTSLTDKVTVNGNVFTDTYTASTKTFLSKSAENRQSSTQIDLLGRPVQSQVAGLFSIANSYDDKGRLSKLTQGSAPDDRSLGFAYDATGYLASVTDPLGRQVSYQYDNAGRIIKQVLPDNREIGFSYDKNGNLTSLTPPGRPAHVFTYSNVDLNDEYTPPNVGAGSNNTVYAFNLDKQLTKITRPDGKTLDYAYDNAGRFTTLTIPDGVFAFAYDSVTGQLDSVTAPDNGKLDYTYSGALLTQAAYTGTVNGSVTYGYDSNMRLSQVSVNGANPVAYSYDKDGLLTKAGSLTLNRSSQNGLLTGTALGNINDTYTYSGFGELATYEAKYSTSPLLKEEYTRDKLGRITKKMETLGVITHTLEYGYDVAGRLAEVKKDGTVISSYTYDSNGNRISGPGLATAPTYDDQDRLLSYSGATFTYTANGELASKTEGTAVTGYTYDVLGNLKHVDLPDGRKLDYVTDAQNRRVGKKINGTLVQGLLWQDQLKPIAQLDGNGSIVSRFVYATGVNVPDYMIKGGVTYRIIKDHLGSPRIVMDVATNNVVQEMAFDEFGMVTKDTNPGFQPFGFAGGLYDRDTSLVRFGARDYDPKTGRWLTKDPILFNGDSSNFYGHNYGDPINFLDIDGRIPLPLITGAIGAITGFGGSLVGQLISNGGNFGCISWKNAFIAGGVGAVAGALAPFAATSYLGAAGLGAGSNVVQYGITQYANGEAMSAGGVAWSAATGAVGGLIGGKISQPKILTDTSGRWIDPALARSLNQDAQWAANSGVGNFLRNLGGSTTGNIDPPSNGSSQSCGCK